MVAEVIQQNLLRTIKFLEPYFPILSSHMVTFITDSLYNNYIPPSFKSEIEIIGTENVLDMLFDHCNKTVIEGSTEIGKFLNTILDLNNANRSVDYYSVNNFKQVLYKNGAKKCDVIHFDEFMSVKKCHEVSIMSALVAELANYTKSSVIVDIGDGKGYLSSFIALEYNLRVLGIDSSLLKTKSAAKRCQKLSKIWKGTRKKIINSDVSQPTVSPKKVDYRQTTEFISDSTDISQIVDREFEENIQDIGVAGLHTCGDLASVCLKSFVKNSDQKFIVNVGCCYHLLTEEMTGNQGFPLSKYLCSLSVKFGRNIRMISLKPKWKIGSERNFPNESLLYRAILQKIIIDKKGSDLSEEFQVGRIAAKCSTFTEYVRMALSKLNLDFQISDDEIQEYLDSSCHVRSQLWIYFMFLTCLSSLIEDVILLDRLLYLKEQGIEKSYFVEMFDPVISPRCNGIIGLRH